MSIKKWIKYYSFCLEEGIYTKDYLLRKYNSTTFDFIDKIDEDKSYKNSKIALKKILFKDC